MEGFACAHVGAGQLGAVPTLQLLPATPLLPLLSGCTVDKILKVEHNTKLLVDFLQWNIIFLVLLAVFPSFKECLNHGASKTKERKIIALSVF